MPRPLIYFFAGAALLLVLLPLLRSVLASPPSASALTDRGYEALGKGNHAEAMEAFERALESLRPADPQYVRAKMGAVEAWIRADASKARKEFLELATSQPEEIGSREYAAVASKMAAAKQFVAAIDVLDAGIQAHPEDPKLKATMDEVKAAAQKAGDPDAVKKLISLGYLGGE